MFRWSARLDGQMGFCIFTLLYATANAAHAQDAFQVHVQAPANPSQWVVVSVPATLRSDGRIEVVADNGETLAAQVDRQEGKPAVTWLVEHLPANASRTYRVRAASPVGADKSTGVEVRPSDEGLDILLDNELFTRYLTNAGPKPYFWPVYGPTGKPMTRAFPMRSDVAGEAHDHEHHRSFWFTFDKVNENDFWSELPRAGKTVHLEFSKLTSGPVFGEFSSRVAWVGKDGQRVCEDVRRLRVYRATGARLFDFEIVVHASHGPLVFGDSKEGLFAFRVAESMKVDTPKGFPRGRLVNANGNQDKEAWGRRSAWCDYSGPIHGETLGISIFDHPGNLRHPTYWHARTYGLFAANPFGARHFTGDAKQDGSYRIEAGGQLRLRYRVLLHKGDAASAHVPETFTGFSMPPKITVSLN